MHDSTTRVRWWRPERHDYSGTVLLSPSASASLPLLLWLLPQLAALIIATRRIALWARFPQPGELLSLNYVLTTQLAVASLLFPVLLRDRGATVRVMLSGWPMVLIAGTLSASALHGTLVCELFVSLWLFSLACWNATLRHSHLTNIAVALASLWALGGALLLYLRVEFAEASALLNPWLAGPIVAVIRALGGEPALREPTLCFIALGAVSLAQLGVRASKRRNRAGSPPSRATTPPPDTAR